MKLSWMCGYDMQFEECSSTYTKRTLQGYDEVGRTFGNSLDTCPVETNHTTRQQPSDTVDKNNDAEESGGVVRGYISRVRSEFILFYSISTIVFLFTL